MTAVKKWVAAGSSAAVLTGGLFMGAPAAYADTCTAPAADGVVSKLVTAADDLHDTSVHFNSLVDDAAVLAELEAAQVQLENAIVQSDTMGPARDAWNTILGLQKTYADNSGDPAVHEAYAASQAAAANFQAVATEARQQEEVFMENGANLVALFNGTCGPLLTDTEPLLTDTDTGAGIWTGTDSDDSDDWAGTGVNQGINMQTAEEGQLPGAGLLAGLLAAVVALSAGAALWLRRARA